MSSRGVVQLASLAWSFGVVALVVHVMPLQSRPGSTIPIQAPQPLDMAVAILRNADRFSSAGVGYAGLTPNEVMAWRVIFFRADAESIFKNLLETATPAGQLYALAGLRFSNSRVFSRTAARLEGRRDLVQTVRGCIAGRQTFAELVVEIKNGDWVRDYIRGSDTHGPS
jgi:hypothetical protein